MWLSDFVAVFGLTVTVTVGSMPSLGLAQERSSTMRIEAPSFVSFQNEARYPISAGSTIRFRLGARQADGSIPFVIQPEDVQMGEVPIGLGARGKYELVTAASGVMRRGSNGLEMTFPARIRATTIPAAGVGRSLDYDVVFTTAKATAMNAARTKTVAPVGKPTNETDGTVELVVATTNRMDAGPIPGAATFAYIVGRFDVVPGKTTPVKAP